VIIVGEIKCEDLMWALLHAAKVVSDAIGLMEDKSTIYSALRDAGIDVDRVELTHVSVSPVIDDLKKLTRDIIDLAIENKCTTIKELENKCETLVRRHYTRKRGEIFNICDALRSII